jgi:hypothetical protein
VAGDQLYVAAPLALRALDVPAQIGVVPVTVIVGIGLTVTTAVAVLLQPPLVPVTV